MCINLFINERKRKQKTGKTVQQASDSYFGIVISKSITFIKMRLHLFRGTCKDGKYKYLAVTAQASSLPDATASHSVSQTDMLQY